MEWRPPGRRLARRSLMLGAIGFVVPKGLWAQAQLSPWPDPTDPAIRLDDVDAAVARVYRVPRITCPDLARHLAADSIDVIDVREPEEFALSHLPGAIRVDPDITADAFIADIVPRLGRRGAAFVCSVGIRSARLLAALDWDLIDEAGGPAACLAGGLFRWVGEHRDLVDQTGRPTREVHPKDAAWGELLARVRAGTG